MPIKWYSVKEAAVELGMGKDYIYAAVRHHDPKKRLESARFGSRIMIRQEAIDEFIRRAHESALEMVEPPPGEPIKRRRRQPQLRPVELVYDINNFDVRDVAEQIRRQEEGTYIPPRRRKQCASSK